MSNLTNFNYNVQTISAGSTSIPDGKTFFTYVVDPNPINEVSVPHEDLFIFVRLRAFPQSRTIITSDNVYSSKSQDEDGIYFIGNAKKEDKGYLTTSYTDINELEGTTEGLGIRSITIDTAMFTPPRVEIEFVDVRGSAIFNNHENKDEGNTYNSSKYNAFFTLPYPIFELVVKGYYGKATTYYLNLIDFNASVDTGKGDFVIKCKFIGYEFAFLSDIITKYVIDLNNTPIGKTLLKQHVKENGEVGLLSLPDLLKKYTQISEYVESYKKQESDYNYLKVLNTLTDLGLEIAAMVNSPSNLNLLPIGQNINYEYFKTGFGYLFIRDVGLFSNNLSNNLSAFQTDLNYKITDFNNIITQNVAINPSLAELTLMPAYFDKSKTYNTIDDSLFTDIQTIITTKENTDYIVLINKDDIKNKMDTCNPYFHTSFYEIRIKVFDINAKIRNEKVKYEEQIVKKLNQTFIDKIGFNPSVFNIFEILMGNTDIFLQQVYDVCKKADSYGVERVGILKDYFETTSNTNPKGSTDIPHTHNKIYPFPGIFDVEGVQVWLGDVVNENNQYFPEIQIVNDIIKSGISENLFEQLNASRAGISQSFESKWVPIHPFDIEENAFSKADSFDYNDPELKDFFDAAVPRYVYILANTYYYNNTTNILSVDGPDYNLMAGYEAAYFIGNVFNKTALLFLQNLSEDDFATKAYDYYVKYGDLLAIPLIYLADANSSDFQTNIYSFAEKELMPTINKLIEDDQAKPIRDVVTLWDDRTNNLYDDSTNIRNIDLSLCFDQTLSINKSIQETWRLENLEQIDGYSIFDSDLNAHLYIGKSIIQYEKNKPMFELFYYNKATDYLKCLFYLLSLRLNLNKNFRPTRENSLLTIPEIYYYLIQFSYFLNENYGGNIDVLDSIKNDSNFNKVKTELYGILYKVMQLSENCTILQNSNALNSFVQYYTLSIEPNLKNYVNLGIKNNLIDAEKSLYKEATDFILKQIKSYRQEVSSSEDLQKFIQYDEAIKFIADYFRNFHRKYQYLLNISSETDASNDSSTNNENSLVVDKNLKIVVYNHLKNLYDKWLSYSTKDGKIYNFSKFLQSNPNNNGNAPTTKLINHCYFVDRTWSYIGDTVVLNPKPLLVYSDQFEGNLYFLISRILKDNNFNFYSIPSYIDYSSKEEVSNMFKPYTTVENNKGGACFVFQYVAGNSKILDFNNRISYVNDGFDFKSDNKLIPSNFVNRTVPKNISLKGNDLQSYLNKYNLCIFRVAYADHNQNIFTDIQVSQEEHRETGESNFIKSELAGGKGGTKRIYLGADLYNFYSVRSYRTDVQCLGNTQILPTQYFQLDNIPLFHGAHMITNVKHTITPNNMITSFGGRRVSRYIYPLIDKITTFFNLELNERISNLTTASEDGDSDGTDNSTLTPAQYNTASLSADFIEYLFGRTSTNKTTLDDGDHRVFTVNVNTPNVTKIAFNLDPAVTTTILNVNLAKLFNSNISSFGLGGGQCAKWVSEALLRIGIARTPSIGLDAWIWAMGLEENQYMHYFSPSDKLQGVTNEEYKKIGVQSGSLIFGYFTGSAWVDATTGSMPRMLACNNPERIKKLAYNNRFHPKIPKQSEKYPCPPITHVGIYYEGVLYDFIGRTKAIDRGGSNSFVPLMWYNFMPALDIVAARHS